jgi:putative oxidoreductase
MWAFLSRNRDAGLLVLRLALGGFFIWAHGWSKLADGAEKWEKLGGAMKHLGINFWPVMWGFLATMAETLGALLFAIGLFFRPACLALGLTMIVAAISEGSFRAGAHAIELAIVFISMIFIGPGKYSVDKD